MDHFLIHAWLLGLRTESFPSFHQGHIFFFFLLYWSSWICSLKLPFPGCHLCHFPFALSIIFVGENSLIFMVSTALHVPLKSLPLTNLAPEYSSCVRLINELLDWKPHWDSELHRAQRAPSHNLPFKTLCAPVQCRTPAPVTFHSFFIQQLFIDVW